MSTRSFLGGIAPRLGVKAAPASLIARGALSPLSAAPPRTCTKAPTFFDQAPQHPLQAIPPPPTSPSPISRHPPHHLPRALPDPENSRDAHLGRALPDLRATSPDLRPAIPDLRARAPDLRPAIPDLRLAAPASPTSGPRIAPAPPCHPPQARSGLRRARQASRPNHPLPAPERSPISKARAAGRASAPSHQHRTRPPRVKLASLISPSYPTISSGLSPISPELSPIPAERSAIAKARSAIEELLAYRQLRAE